MVKNIPKLLLTPRNDSNLVRVLKMMNNRRKPIVNS